MKRARAAREEMAAKLFHEFIRESSFKAFDEAHKATLVLEWLKKAVDSGYRAGVHGERARWKALARESETIGGGRRR